MQSLTDTFTLSNGVEIPCIGFGTWQTDDARTSTLAAIQAEYRHIDTADAYGNEETVAAAVRESGVPREELFLTTKLWNANRGYDTTLAAFEESARKLETNYIDLYLIHWPANALQFSNWAELNAETWRAFEDLYDAGRIRAIGLSNFTVPYIEELKKTSRIEPMVNQIEFHPGYRQEETLEYCQNQDILIEAWSPLGSGRLLQDSQLTQIANEYGITVAQLCVRWCLQQGVLPLPKSVAPDRIAENADVFEFEIAEKDIAVINAMVETGFSGMHPDTATW